MRAESFEDVDRFLEVAGDFLGEREAEHNLLLGICSTLKEGPGYGDESPCFWVVKADGEIVGAALRTPPFNLALSEIDHADGHRARCRRQVPDASGRAWADRGRSSLC